MLLSLYPQWKVRLVQAFARECRLKWAPQDVPPMFTTNAIENVTENVIGNVIVRENVSEKVVEDRGVEAVIEESGIVMVPIIADITNDGDIQGNWRNSFQGKNIMISEIFNIVAAV